MKKKLETLDIVIIISLIISVIITLIVFMRSFQKDTVKKDENVVQTNKINNEENSNEIQNMGERDRMEYYFSEFIDYIENGEYKKAYEILYPEFRERYFKTLDDFKNYVDKTYPEFVSFNYNDIERQGDIYVLTIVVINPDVSKEESKKSQRIVIKENDFNDFVLSFQVI